MTSRGGNALTNPRVLVLAFAMVAGINIIGYPKPLGSKQYGSTNEETSAKIAQMFEYSGVSAAGRFLKKLLDGCVVGLASAIGEDAATFTDLLRTPLISKN